MKTEDCICHGQYRASPPHCVPYASMHRLTQPLSHPAPGQWKDRGGRGHAAPSAQALPSISMATLTAPGSHPPPTGDSPALSTLPGQVSPEDTTDGGRGRAVPPATAPEATHHSVHACLRGGLCVWRQSLECRIPESSFHSFVVIFHLPRSCTVSMRRQCQEYCIPSYLIQCGLREPVLFK